ncbi:siderophore-interacting protein [Nesterenkonia suensis]
MSRLAQILPAPKRATPPPRRETYRAFPTTVHAVTELTPRMRRFTLRSPQFTTHRRTRPDEFFGLLLPRGDALHVPERGMTGTTPRGIVSALSEADRPELRWYTIRDHRPDDGEIDVDIVLHGSGPESGPGSRWAEAAQPGDTVGFAEGNGMYNPPAGARRQLFFADITAVPALCAILESATPAPGRPRPDRDTIAHIEVPTAEDITPITTEATVHWHVRGTQPAGFSIPLLRDAVVDGGSTHDPVDYAWVCAEAEMVKQARRLLIREAVVPRERITFSGYWRLGEARG